MCYLCQGQSALSVEQRPWVQQRWKGESRAGACLGSALLQQGLPGRAAQAGGSLAQLLHMPQQAVTGAHYLLRLWGPTLVQL